MKVVILYRPKSEHATKVEQWVHDFTWKNPERKVELLDIDTKEGTAKAELYGIVQYPALVATQDSGELLQQWQGDELPLMNEVAYYAQS